MHVADLGARSQPAQSAVTRTQVQILKLVASTNINGQQFVETPRKQTRSNSPLK